MGDRVFVIGERRDKVVESVNGKSVNRVDVHRSQLDGWEVTPKMQEDEKLHRALLLRHTRHLYEEMLKRHFSKVEVWEPWRNMMEDPRIGLTLYRGTTKLRGGWAGLLEKAWAETIEEAVKAAGPEGVAATDLERKLCGGVTSSSVHGPLPYVLKGTFARRLSKLADELVVVKRRTRRNGRRLTVYIHADHAEA